MTDQRLRRLADRLLRPCAGHLPEGADRPLSGLVPLFIRDTDRLAKKSAQHANILSCHVYLAAEHRGKANDVIAPENIFDVRQLGFIKKVVAGQRVALLAEQRGQRRLPGGLN